MAEPSLTDDSRSFDRPPVQIASVTATTSYDAAGLPRHSPLAEGAVTEGVALSASFHIYFDRFLLPQTVTRQAVCVRPASEPVTRFEDCAEPGQPFTQPEYNPVLRQVIYRLGPTRLEPDTVYRLTVYREEDATRPGLFAFDGAPMARAYTFDFQTQDASSPAFDEASPSPERFCEAIACFEQCAGDAACNEGCRSLCVEPTCAQNGAIHQPGFLFGGCAFSGCHGPAKPSTPSPDYSVVAAGLDLYNAAGLAATAIGKTAHQTQQGEASTVGEQSPLRFGRAMPLVDPRNPGNSYLLYKLIIHPLNHFRPGGVLDPQLEAEIGRLRASAVSGLPMPAEAGAPIGLVPTASDPEGILSLQHMLLIDAWIAAGAVLSCD